MLYPLPRVAGGQSANYLKPSMFFSITDQCQNADQAAMFIDYFTNNIEANDVLLAERGVPVSSHVRDHLASEVDPVNAKIFQFIARRWQRCQPGSAARTGRLCDLVSNVFSPEFTDPVLFGMITPQEGWQTFVTDANAILEQNNGSSS